MTVFYFFKNLLKFDLKLRFGEPKPLILKIAKYKNSGWIIDCYYKKMRRNRVVFSLNIHKKA